MTFKVAEKLAKSIDFSPEVMRVEQGEWKVLTP